MSQVPNAPDFRTPMEAVQYMERRAGEIQGVAIPRGPSHVVKYMGRPMVELPNLGMVVDFPDMRVLLTVEQAEAVLNDGLFTRQSVPVKLFPETV